MNVSSTNGEIKLTLNQEDFTLSVKGHVWSWREDYRPYIDTASGKIYFSEALNICHEPWQTGVGCGIRSIYKEFKIHGKVIPFAFETVVWIEESTNDVFFEFIPICEDGIEIKAVYWPGPMEFSDIKKDWYTLINLRQGLMIPNDWPNEISKVTLDGHMCSAASSMPWWGQVRPDSGYIAICKDPWDAAYKINKAIDCPTEIGIKWLPSLGTIRYKRQIRYTFLEKCDYNDLCKVYRKYAKEVGNFVSLAEKSARNPLVDKLIGSAVIHKGIKTNIVQESRMYNKEDISKNKVITPFKIRTEEMKKLKAAGVEKAYLHLDGWGDPGYDNKHPDYLPPCIEAGGIEGILELSNTMSNLGYMFGIHDQYRDYYFDAPTFDKNFAVTNVDGTIPENYFWAGGHQTFICPSQSIYYVRRNFQQLFKYGVHLEAAYLDVFTCNELDECNHPWHKVTRRECAELRKSCFDYLLSQNILPSSEEVVDWAMPSLVFCHYAPYEFMFEKDDSKDKGIPVPLLNLVYHDCIIIPWILKAVDFPAPLRNEDKTIDYKLYAILNGGGAYLDSEAEEKELEREIARYREVATLQEKVAKCEMVKHDFLDEDYKIQRTLFSDGTEVTVDFNKGDYSIKRL